ncbi:MAG: hypothetical protein AUK43_08370 [Oscillatoriales cyanobacterium CG2_30_40_61]|nr:MAG: hypothetical protein AUK43_08370 [Oscillatoriales cyanobacterium CG2_30_40_61]
MLKISLTWRLGMVLIAFCSFQACQFAGQRPKPDPVFNLTSNANINYQPLKQLLTENRWKQADQETLRILLKLSNRQAEGWLGQKDVEGLACEDLQIINRLWNYYSDGRFGFSQQEKIWISVGGIIGEYSPEIAEKFGDRVRWRKGGQWLKYEQLNFSARAPQGHLPATTGNGVSGGVWNGVAAITHRVKYCGLIDALAAGEWTQADMKTLELFEAYRIPIENRPHVPPPLVISEIPCAELQGADRLWVKYSGGRFGLSVQGKILKATGNSSEKIEDRYQRFEKAVGWGIDHREMTDQKGDPKTIPLGHFPYRLGHSYDTFGSGFNRTWRLSINPDCGF